MAKPASQSFLRVAKTVKGWTKKCYREMIDDAEELELFEEEIAPAAERKTMDLQGLKEILMKLASDDYPINSKQERPQSGIELEEPGVPVNGIKTTCSQNKRNRRLFLVYNML